MPEMLTARDMQVLLQVDRSTIYRMAEAGQLPAIKVGKQWRFPSDQVEQWLRERTIARFPGAQGVPTAFPEGVSLRDDLAALLPLPCVQLIQDLFAELANVMVVVTDMEGNPVTKVSRPCGLFCVIDQVPHAIRTCVASWQALGATPELEARLLPTSLGVLCVRGLVRIGNELKGMVIMGGIAPDDWPPPPEEIQAIAARHGVDADLLAAHIHEVYYVDASQRTRLVHTVQRIADVIAHIANERRTLMEKLAAIAQLTR
ncbi:MAG: PocR ligand-binding domain-containing protein [Anaerolineae bacterium]|nr:PocR ligand-binding domain-containing protein [Anaerolineae bacterium]